MELEKLLKQSKDENAEGKGPKEEKEHVVYVTPSRKLERFKGKPAKGTDPSVEEWIEYARATCESKGLKEKAHCPFPARTPSWRGSTRNPGKRGRNQEQS